MLGAKLIRPLGPARRNADISAGQIAAQPTPYLGHADTPYLGHAGTPDLGHAGTPYLGHADISNLGHADAPRLDMRTLPTSDMRTLLASDMPRVDASVFFPDFDLSSIQVYVPMTCAQIVQTLTWRRYQPGAGVGVGVGVGCTVHGRAFYVAVWASTFAYCVVPGGLHAPEVARVPCAKSCAVCHLVDIDIKTKARAGSLSPAELPQPISTWSVLSPRHCDDLRLDKIAVRCIRPTCQGNGIRTHGRTEVSDVSL